MTELESFATSLLFHDLCETYARALPLMTEDQSLTMAAKLCRYYLRRVGRLAEA